MAIMAFYNIRPMRLLIITQKVDADDSILGFFHRWITEFAKRCESVTIICLELGEHELPANVRILSLGKEEKVSRVKYLRRFFSYIWKERENYDAVFVHMNPEYVVLGGWLWHMWSKRVALWYTHKSVDLKLRLAAFFSDVIFTASRESFRLESEKVKVLGHGIDVDFFSPDEGVVRGEHLLTVGRLMSTKRHDLAISAAAIAHRPIRIAGEGTERVNLESLASKLGVAAEFLGPLNQDRLREEYRRAAFLVHTSETGSLDKVVLESLACGLKVISSSPSLSDLPIIITAADPQSIAQKISAPDGHRDLATFVREKHSLQSLIPRILDNIENI